MNDSKLRMFSLFLRAYGWGSLLLFSFLMIGFTLKLSVLDVGGPLHFMVWGPLDDHVAPMLLAVYIPWSIYIIIAARDPQSHRMFIQFTVWANLAHGVVMIPHALMAPEYYVKFATDIPWVFLPAIAMLALRPWAKEAATKA